jgi:hypothetical protein
MSQQAGRYQRSAAGMVGAMVVLVLVVIGFVLFRDLNRNDPPSPVRTVDYEQAAEYARDQAGFDVLSPADLPEGWRATSVRYLPGETESWHLGLLTEEDRYVGLEQSGGSADAMVEEHVDPDAVEGEPVDVAGQDWATWSDSGGDLALVRETDGTTTLVVGHEVPEAALADFAARLR